MIKHSKTYQLNERQSSYLLLINQNFIITNNNYSEVILLTHELEFVRTIHFPREKFISYYEYKNESGSHFLLYEDEGEMFFLLDVIEGKITFIRDIILQRVSVNPSYLWTDHTFTALAYLSYPSNPSILSIDTLSKNITLIPFDNRFNKAPQFADFLETETKYKARPIGCNQEYMYKADFHKPVFEEPSNMQIINSVGTVVRKFSITNELEEELTRLYKRNPVAHELPERFPHNLEYQNGWILLIWEGKVVVIDPNNQRTTILMNNYDYSAYAKFITSNDSHARFVILVYNDLKKIKAELRLYEATTSEIIQS